MKVVWASDAWEQYLEWQRTDFDVAKKINELVEDARRRPFQGLGKPEPRNGPLQGWGPVASLANTGWCIGFLGKVISSSWKSPSVGGITVKSSACAGHSLIGPRLRLKLPKAHRFAVTRRCQNGAAQRER